MELLMHGTLQLAILIVAMLSAGYFLCKSFPRTDVFPLRVAQWLVISSMICVWDASFVLLRPWSFDHPLWSPYRDYVQVDKLYGDLESDFVWSQSILNVAEICVNALALFMLRSGQPRKGAVTALFVCACTASKTLLYHVMEVSCGLCNVGHNDAKTLVMLYLIPNGIWIAVPILCAFALGKNLAVAAKPGKTKTR